MGSVSISDSVSQVPLNISDPLREEPQKWYYINPQEEEEEKDEEDEAA